MQYGHTFLVSSVNQGKDFHNLYLVFSKYEAFFTGNNE